MIGNIPALFLVQLVTHAYFLNSRLDLKLSCWDRLRITSDFIEMGRAEPCNLYYRPQLDVNEVNWNRKDNVVKLTHCRQFSLIVLPSKWCCSRVAIVALQGDRVEVGHSERQSFSTERAWTGRAHDFRLPTRGGRSTTFTLDIVHAPWVRLLMLHTIPLNTLFSKKKKDNLPICNKAHRHLQFSSSFKPLLPNLKRGASQFEHSALTPQDHCC